MDALGYTNSPYIGRPAAGQSVGHGLEAPDEFSDHDAPERDRYQETTYRDDDLDLDEEQAEGRRQEAELLARHPLWIDPATAEQLDCLLRALLPHSRRPEIVYRFMALDCPAPFASSCCHGAVYFSCGLLNALNYDQVLFFAAHEMAHTELRHYASRQRRLQELRRGFPAAPGSAARQRLEGAAVLAVRHQEEFEADHQAARHTGERLGAEAMLRLHESCQRLAPESLRRPTHPPFEQRLERIKARWDPPEPVGYLWSLVAP